MEIELGSVDFISRWISDKRSNKIITLKKKAEARENKKFNLVYSEFFFPKKFPIRLMPLTLRDAKPFVSLLRLTLRSDFSLKLLCASEPNLRERDFGLSDSIRRLCTGFVTIEMFTANNNSARSASHGVNWNETDQSYFVLLLITVIIIPSPPLQSF